MGKPTLLHQQLVRQHVRCCKLKPGRCGLCHWAKHKDNLKKTLRNPQWLQVTLNRKRARVGCAACALAEAGGPWASFDLQPQNVSAWKVKKHEATKTHLAAEEAFSVSKSVATSTSFAAPLKEFEDSLAHMRAGGSSRAGGCSSDRKDNVRWAISEAVLDRTRRWLQQAESIALCRDERKGRLLIRYRACLSDLRVVEGVLGFKSMDGAADSIAACTLKAIEELCHPMLYPPRSCPQAVTEAVSYKPEVARRIQERTSILVTDAAAPELLASDVLRGKRAYAETCERRKDFPNVTIVGRDAAHASTRLLKRPFQHHPDLQSILEEFVSGSESFCQKIHHSPLHSQWWKQAGGDSLEDVGSAGSLSAAKHRFGSYLQPLSRICRQMPRMLEVSHKIAFLRDSSGSWASQLLRNFTGFKAILLCLAADAAATAMELTRFCDSEFADVSELNRKVEQFCASCQALFIDEKVFELPTFSKGLLDQLAAQPMQILIDGKGREIRIGQGDKVRALKIMTARSVIFISLTCWWRIA